MIMITYGGQEVTRSPFEVNVGPYKESAIKAYGPGLSGGVVGYPALFTVETNGETGALGKQQKRKLRENVREKASEFQNVDDELPFFSFVILGFSIEGPSQAKIDCHDNGNI